MTDGQIGCLDVSSTPTLRVYSDNTPGPLATWGSSRSCATSLVILLLGTPHLPTSENDSMKRRAPSA